MDQKHPIRIATVTIKHWPTGKFTISLALASNQPFVNLVKQKRHLVQDSQAVGIDFNTSKFASQSIGCDTINPRYYRHDRDWNAAKNILRHQGGSYNIIEG